MNIKKINALYSENTVRVYQAFSKQIANEAITLGRFGPSFNVNRMTWIKPSFLWMMYRSGWATKEGQERILAVDIKSEGFNYILENAILSTFDKDLYTDYDTWQNKLRNSEVRCQWDPDRDIFGNPLDKRAIQIGLRGNIVGRYIDEWIVEIRDITKDVKIIKETILLNTFNENVLPTEREYPLNETITKILGMTNCELG